MLSNVWLNGNLMCFLICFSFNFYIFIFCWYCYFSDLTFREQKEEIHPFPGYLPSPFPPPQVGHIAITHQGRALLCTTGLNAGIPLPSHSNASSCSTKSTCWNCPYSAHEIPWKTHNCQSFSYHCHSNSYQPGFLSDCLPESHKAVNIHHV